MYLINLPKYSKSPLSSIHVFSRDLDLHSFKYNSVLMRQFLNYHPISLKTFTISQKDSGWQGSLEVTSSKLPLKTMNEYWIQTRLLWTMSNLAICSSSITAQVVIPFSASPEILVRIQNRICSIFWLLDEIGKLSQSFFHCLN